MKNKILTLIAFFHIIFIFSQQKNQFQKFNLDNYLNNSIQENSIGSVGCSYGITLKDYENGNYYYSDDYDNLAVVKINNKFYEFNIISESNKNAVKKGFVNARHQNYILKVIKIPHFKNKKFDYTEATITIENLKTNQKSSIVLFGYCGC